MSRLKIALSILLASAAPSVALPKRSVPVPPHSLQKIHEAQAAEAEPIQDKIFTPLVSQLHTGADLAKLTTLIEYYNGRDNESALKGQIVLAIVTQAELAYDKPTRDKMSTILNHDDASLVLRDAARRVQGSDDFGSAHRSLRNAGQILSPDRVREWIERTASILEDEKSAEARAARSKALGEAAANYQPTTENPKRKPKKKS